MIPVLRCYLPLTPADLLALHRSRHLPPSVVAFVARRTTGGQSATVDQEEMEHTALQAAAHHALARGGPVIVAAADLEQDGLEQVHRAGAAEGQGVRVTREVRLPRVAALHVGDDFLGAATTLVVDDDAEIELSWYDTTEVEHLVGLL